MRRGIIELIGRGRGPQVADFPEDVLVLNGEPFNVGLLSRATYVNLPPETAALIMGPDGQRYLVERGGYLELRPGRYGVQFVDLRGRQKTFSKLSATTSDGFTVALSLIVLYKALKPALIVQIDRPAQVFFTAVEAAAKNYVLSHTHDEVIKTNENDGSFDQRELESYIRKEVSDNPVCAAFELSNIRVQEWEGDAKYIGLRKDRQLQEMQSRLKQEQKQQEQRIVSEDQTLERQRAEVSQIKAAAEAERDRIMSEAQRLKNEVANIGRLPERRHAEIMEVINAIKDMPGFPRNATEAKILQELTDALLDKQGMTGAAAARDNGAAPQAKAEEKIGELTQTILDMLRPPGGSRKN